MVHLNASRFTSFEYKNKIYKVDAPADHVLEDMLQPNYWAHVARVLRTGDEVIVVSEDNVWRAHFHILNAGDNWANVYCLKFDEMSKIFEMPADADTSYIVEHSGNFHKWRVRKKGEDKALVAQLVTRDEALKWLADYKKTLKVKRPEQAA